MVIIMTGITRLRYFQTYDKNGLDSEVSLQYWDNDIEEWLDVGFVRVSEKDEDEYRYDKYQC